MIHEQWSYTIRKLLIQKRKEHIYASVFGANAHKSLKMLSLSMGESFCLENDQAGQTGKILFYSFFNCLETLAHYAAAAEKRKFVYF